MTIPRWVEVLVRAAAPAQRGDDAVGDLNEMLDRRARTRGRLVAQLLTIGSALDLVFECTRHRLRPVRAYPAGAPGRAPAEIHRRRTMMTMLEGWVRDFARAVRSLGRVPGYTAVAVFTLALAIGATTAIYSVVDAVLLDPLDYPNAERLVDIRGTAPGSDLPEEFGVGPEFFVQYSEEASLLEDLALYQDGQTTVRSDDRTDRLFVVQNTASLYSTLGVRPVLGTLPTVEDAPRSVMMISYDMWTEWFGQDPEVVVRSYEVSGQMIQVAGVMGPDMRFPDERVSVWVHQALGDPSDVPPGEFGFGLVGRVTPDADLDALTSQLATLASRLPERFGGPPQYAEIISQHRPVVRTLEEVLVGDFTRPLWLLFATVGIVLLIACANVANLFTARADGREKDLAVRRALGAGRGGLVRLQMAEALVLAAAGGAVGTLLATLGLPLLVRAAPENMPNLASAGLEQGALVFAMGISLGAAMLFGLLPALHASRGRVIGGLRQSGTVGRSGRGRDTLVLVQTAAALVLLVSAGLLLRSFWTLSNVDPGFETEDVFTFQVAPDRDELVDGPTYAAFHLDFAEKVAALPGVEAVGYTNWLPLDEGAGRAVFPTEEALVSGEMPPPVRMTFVGGDYFEVMQIDVLRGRALGDGDHVVGSTSAVVSEAAAEAMWPGEDALGKRFTLDPNSEGTWATVVGVAEDIVLSDYRQVNPDPMVYLPSVGPAADTWAVGSPAYVVKTARAGSIAPDVRALMLQEVPESPMYRVFTMSYLEQRSMGPLHFTMLILVVASTLALILGAVGLYGVLSYVVASRGREIAVRMALGAGANLVRLMILAQGARVTILGVGVGILVAVGMTRLLDSMLYGVTALDLRTFAAMSLVMFAVALLASYIPARRASSVDPMHAFREDL